MKIISKSFLFLVHVIVINFYLDFFKSSSNFVWAATDQELANLPQAEAFNSWPFFFYFLAVFVLVGAMLGISFVLGSRHVNRATNQPYESGILITGPARVRFSSQFYLVAMFFVVFDLEAVFLYAWAVAVPELGWAGFFQVLVFIFLLLVALIYLWGSGGLEFGPSLRKIKPQKKQEK